MWLVVCVFIFFVAVGLIGNVPESLDRVYHLHRPALGNQAPVEQHAEVIKASKLDVEAARAQSAEVKPGEVEPSDAPVNKDASKATSKVALCTSIKWEQPADMEEWVQYYQYVTICTSLLLYLPGALLCCCSCPGHRHESKNDIKREHKYRT